VSGLIVPLVSSPERHVLNVESDELALAAVEVVYGLDSTNTRLPHSLRVIVRLDRDDVDVFFEVRPASSSPLAGKPAEGGSDG